jgi:transcriptional regulator with XRE-family HTH domain
MKIKEIEKMAERIKERRAELHFTQEQFAETIGLSTSSYVKIENAFQRPALETLKKISRTLNTSLDYLVFGDAEIRTDRPEADLAISFFNRCSTDKLKHARDILENIISIKNPKRK